MNTQRNGHKTIKAIASAFFLSAGQRAYERGDYITALNHFQPLAQKQGNADAQFYLGKMYHFGYGVSQDEPLAAKWITLAAEQGQAAAQNELGWLYAQGLGVSQDERLAAKWITLAAQQGHAAAQNRLGWLYATGEGVEKDSREAVKWYKKAAQQGNAHAQYILGVMFDSGEGVVQDYITAHFWFNLAASQEGEWSRLARDERDRMAKKMTPDQIATAQRLAREWRPVKPRP